MQALIWEKDVNTQNTLGNEQATPHNLKVALEHAVLGIKVFPCIAKDKSPCISKWQHEATDDPAVLRHWWKTWPTALVGRPGGANGFVTIDIDRKPGGADGALAFDNLLKEHNGTGNGFVVTSTAGGGYHLTFRVPEGLQFSNATGNLPNGIDVRGHAGYVICEGSQTLEGKRYAPAGTGFLAAAAAGVIPVLPQWLCNVIQPVSHPAAFSVPVGDAGLATEAHDIYFEKKLAQLIAQVRNSAQGSGNNTLNSRAHILGQWHGLGWGDTNRTASLLYNSCLEQGWYDELGAAVQQEKLQATIAGAITAGMAQPGGPLYAEWLDPVACLARQLQARFLQPPAQELSLAELAAQAAYTEQNASGPSADDENDAGYFDAGLELINENKRIAEEILALRHYPDAPIAPRLQQVASYVRGNMHNPDTELALWAAVTIIGSRFARKYKTADRLACNVFLAVAMPSGEGKGESFAKLTKKLHNIATRGYSANRTSFRRPREYSPFNFTGTASVQGLFDAQNNHGNMLWFSEEGKEFLTTVLNPRQGQEVSVQRHVLTAFDAGSGDMVPARLPTSMTAKLSNKPPIHNATMSAIATLTFNTIRTDFTKDVYTSGIGARFLFLVRQESVREQDGDHTGHCAMLADLENYLEDLLDEAADYDDLHKDIYTDGKPGDGPVCNYDNLKVAMGAIRFINYGPGALQHAKQISRAVDKYVVESNLKDGTLGQHYSLLNRLGMIVKSYALINALARCSSVAEREGAACITIADIDWALGFVLPQQMKLLAMFDAGDVGEASQQERIDTVLGWLRGAAEGKYNDPSVKTGGWVRIGFLSRRANASAKFDKDNPNDPYGLKAIIGHLLANGNVIQRDVLGNASGGKVLEWRYASA